MKKHLTFFILLSILSSIVLINPICASSGPPDPPAATGGAGCWPPPCVPIDKGIVFLLISGVGLGLVSIYRSGKRV